MKTKEQSDFYAQLDRLDFENPEVILLTGSDHEIMNTIQDRLKNRLLKSVGAFETTVFTGEPDDEKQFLRETFNIPLFAPYRMIIVRQAHEVFKPLLQNRQALLALKSDFSHLPERTLILIQFSGDPPASFLSVFGSRLLHFTTKNLYADQAPDFVRKLARNMGLTLDDEGVFTILERVEPRPGDIETALRHLKDSLTVVPGKPLSPQDIKDQLFPGAGYNPFELIDALFRADFRSFEKEMTRFNPAFDNLFLILKLILNRINEIRKASLGRRLGMNDSELITFLGLKGRHAFVQKKILQRLSHEQNRFTDKHMSAVYEMLPSLHREFRSSTDAAHQPLLFEKHVLDVFFF